METQNETHLHVDDIGSVCLTNKAVMNLPVTGWQCGFAPYTEGWLSRQQFFSEDRGWKREHSGVTKAAIRQHPLCQQLNLPVEGI